MSKVYLITESQFDEEILKKLLPKDAVNNVQFVAGAGQYSAQSLARSILAVRHEPVALVLAAKTTEPSLIEEHQDFLREALKQAAAGAPFGIFLAEPELEILFLESPDRLGHLFSRDFSSLELELAKSSPRKFLHLISGERDRKKLMKKLIRNIDEQSLRAMRKHPLLSKLAKFLSSTESSETDFNNPTDDYGSKSNSRTTTVPR
jgi:hypothetical protein